MLLFPIGEDFLICEMEGFILACQTCFWIVPQSKVVWKLLSLLIDGFRLL